MIITTASPEERSAAYALALHHLDAELRPVHPDPHLVPLEVRPRVLGRRLLEEVADGLRWQVHAKLAVGPADGLGPQ